MPDHRDRIAVALCTYNGSRFISEQVESIALQTRLPDELVVCDDASTDDTVEVVQRFSLNAPFPVHLVLNQSNIGWQRNFEQALSLCEAEFLFPSDQDDVWLPCKMQKMEALLLSQPAIGLVFCNAEYVDESLQPLDRTYWDGVGFTREERRAMGSGKALEILIRHNVVAGCMMGFRSHFRQEVLPIPKTWGHDGWIALLIAATSRIAAIDEVLVQYRRHETQQVGVLHQRLPQRLSNYSDFHHIAEAYAVAAERLQSLPDVHRRNWLVSQAQGKSHHLMRRASLPDFAPSRLRAVFTELLKRNYHRYSNGFHSAFKDLLAPPSP